MLEQFLGHIQRNRLCHKLDSILLAVSGGLDSTVMLYLFQEAGFNIGVAHCNFQLRGGESDGDQQFVTQLCKEFDIPLFLRRFETEAYAWEKTLSIQLAARELRYKWFKELTDSKLYTHVATAHHFDDTMETIVMNLVRGSGLDGLAGIPVRNGPIIRPLMFATRKQVEDYALKKGIVWREDSSNLTDQYQRNHIRHHVIPKLREMNPSLDVTWRAGLEKVNHEISIIHRIYDSWKAKFVREKQGRVLINKAAIDLYPNNPAMLWRFIRNFGFNFEQSGDIQRSLHNQPGRRFFSPSHLLVIDRDQVIIIDREQDWQATLINAGDETSYLGPWSLSVTDVSADATVVFERSADESMAVFDGAVLRFPLVWRKWRPGDHFYPLGLGHKKKLSDFFVDQKLSIADKDQATVLECNGQIAWVVGYRIDDRFKITDATTQRMSLKISLL